MQFESTVKRAFIAACACLALGGLGFRIAMSQLNVYLQKESVPLRAPVDELPSMLGGWKQVGKDQQLSDAVVEELGTKTFLIEPMFIKMIPSKARFRCTLPTTRA